MKEIASIGIDVSEREARFVRMVHGPDGSRVTGAAVIPLSDPKAISAGLAQVKRTPRDTLVLDVPAGETIVKMVSLPPATPDAMHLLVAGEVEHLQFLDGGDASHGYLVMRPPSATAGEPVPVSVFGVSGVSMRQGREVLSGLRPRGAIMEPAQIAMLRAGLSMAPAEVSGLFLMVDRDATGIAYLHQGALSFFRQLDHGSHVFVRARQLQSGAVGVDEETVAEEVVKESMLSLAREIQRTVNYLSREFGASFLPDACFLLVDQPESEALAESLGDFTGLPVHFFRLPESPEADLAGPMACKMATAYGLALAAAPNSPLSSVDLLTADRTAERRVQHRRGSIIQLGVLGGILLVGFGAAMFLGAMTAQVKSRLEGTLGRVAALDGEAVTRAEESQRRREHLQALLREGVPLGPMVDLATRSLQDGLGIATFEVDPDHQVRISGEAVSENALFRWVSQLQQGALLEDVTIQSFERMLAPSPNGIRFQVHGRAVTSDRVERVPHQPRRDP